MPKDPVCGKEISADEARNIAGHTMHGAAEVDPTKGTRSFHNGKWYYFCSMDCRAKFVMAPAKYQDKG